MDYTNGGTWRTAGSLPTSRYGLKAASIDGQLYVSKFSDMFPKKGEKIFKRHCVQSDVDQFNLVLKSGDGRKPEHRIRNHQRNPFLGAHLGDLDGVRSKTLHQESLPCCR